MASSVGHRPVGVKARFLLAVGFALALVLALLPSASPAQATPQAHEVSEYRQDFPGLSAQQAEKRLETQRKGAGIVSQLKRDLGPDYAGVWFDSEAGEFVVPVLPGADRGSVHAELAGSRLDNDYRTSPATYSWAELQAAQESIDQRLSAQIQQGLVQTSLNPRANAVLINLAQGADKSQRHQVQRLAAAEGPRVDLQQVNANDLRVELRGCRTYSPRICDKPLRGGVGIGPDSSKEGFGNQGLCSMGFKATGDVYGNRFVLTAGHCTPGVDNWSSTVYTGEKEEPIGAAEESTFPGGDWAKIKANGSEWDTSPWPSQVAHYWEDQNRAINYEAYSYLGQYVCHSGTSTGSSCGNVLALDVTVSDGEATIYHETKFGEDCGAEGDSGGPAFSGNTALGIYNAGDSNGKECPPGSGQKNGENGYYTEITEATDAMGVSVGTRIGGAPSAATGSAANLQPYQATMGGSVNPNGVETEYHFEWGTSTNYTNQNPYPDGNVGHGTSPAGVNETIYNLQPATTYHYRLYAHNAAGDSHGSDATFKTPPAPPKATTEAASNMHVAEETGKATLNGKVNPGGADTDYRFEWGKASEGFPNKAPVPDGDAGDGIAYVSVPVGVSGLKGQTEYQYRIRAENSEGTVTSSVTKFTTPDWRPSISTLEEGEAFAEEDTGKIKLFADVNPKGFATTFHIEWGDQEEFEAEEFNNSSPEVAVGNGQSPVEVMQTIEGLKGQNEYHYRLVAENVEGSNDGEGIFTTPDWRPKISHIAAIDVERDDATLSARINPNGFTTDYRFEWADQKEFEAEEYSHSLPAEAVDIGNGTEHLELTQPLEGLKERRTYHLRVVAENAEGTRTTSDHPFTTSISVWLMNEAGKARLYGSPDGMFSFTTEGKVYCNGPEFEAQIWGGASEGGVATTSVEGMTCDSGFGKQTPVEMNGCGFEFDPDFGKGIEGTIEGEFNIGPPGCGPIEWTREAGYCEISIPSQTGRRAQFTNLGEGSDRYLEIELKATELRYEGAGGACYEHYADGQLEGTWEVEAKAEWGEEQIGQQVGLWVDPLLEPNLEVLTLPATEVGLDEATLHASVDTAGQEASYEFEYGTTSEYGSTTSEQSIEAGAYEPAAVEQTIEGLELGTTYHFRVHATVEDNGNRWGEDVTFTTSPRRPARFEAEEHPAVLAAERDSAEDSLLSSSSLGDLRCESAQLSGAMDEAAAAVRIDAQYGGCELAAAELAATVQMNSCHYLYGVDDAGPPYSGGLQIACDEEGDAIEVALPELEATIEIPEQALGGGVEYEVQGEGSSRTVHADIDAEGVSYSCSGTFCFLLDNDGNGEDGTIGGGVTLESLDDAEDQLGLYIAPADPIGLFLSGEESPEFDAEEHPAVLAAERDSAEDSLLSSSSLGDLRCESAQLSGAMDEAAAAVRIDAQYGGCELAAAELAATVQMNSCHYLYGVDDAGPPYSGGLQIACDEEGDAIEVALPELEATIEIPEQALGGGVEYEVQGEGSSRTVHADIDAEGVSYSCSGVLCFLLDNDGNGEDGTIGGGVSIRGHK